MYIDERRNQSKIIRADVRGDWLVHFDWSSHSSIGVFEWSGSIRAG